MSIVMKPACLYPSYEVKQEDMISILKDLYPYHPKWSTIERMIRNTNVSKRNLVKPIDEIIIHSGLESRNNIYKKEALKLSEAAALEALSNANLGPKDIDLIIVTSCTGFMMPSLTAYLIDLLDMKPSTKQLPVSQLGCVAGAWAINRAYEYTQLYPTHNVLVVSVEFSSLVFQPTDRKLASLISYSLFGDGVTACVIKGQAEKGDVGFQIVDTQTFTKRQSQHYITYDYKDTGMHFSLDKDVMHSIVDVAPIMEELSQESLSKEMKNLDFYVFHTGGRKILDELTKHLILEEDSVRESRKSLDQQGNIASCVVFDVLNREFELDRRKSNDLGCLAAFGPGFTAEICVGKWIAN